MEAPMRKFFAVLAVLFLAGCVTTDVRDTLSAATLAEQRVGEGSALALSSIAALSTRVSITVEKAGSTMDAATVMLASVASVVSAAQPAEKELAGLVSELRAVTAVVRDKAEDGWLTKRMIVGVGVLVLLVGIHSVVTAMRTKKHLVNAHSRIDAMHNDVKGLRHG